jgi:Flp pilus assembly protein TadG
MRWFNKFRRDESGAVFLLFGLALVPILGLVGAALDYARTSAARVRLQSAIDAGVLFAARDSQSLTPAQVDQRIRDAVMANLNGKVNISPSAILITHGDRSVTVTAATGVETSILKVLHINTLAIAANTRVAWGTNDIEIALALDNTGSMGSSNKLNELKKALCGDAACGNTSPTAGFIKIMKDAATYDGQIKISVVPFDTGVRMPQNIQNQVNTGTPVSTVYSNTGAGYCGSNPTTAKRVNWFRFADRDKDTTATNKNAANVNVGTGCGVGRVTPANWQGCVWDRDQASDYDAKDILTNMTDINQLHPAVNCRSNNLARILTLTDVRTNTATLVNALKTMQPSGNTNLTPGISWGLATITNGVPFTEAQAPSATVKKFMILMTDGENTENRYSTNSGTIDPRAKKACANVKALGITLYTIRVIDGDKALLESCATSVSYYKEVANASELTPVFEAIAKEIGAVRLTN